MTVEECDVRTAGSAHPLHRRRTWYRYRALRHPNPFAHYFGTNQSWLESRRSAIWQKCARREKRFWGFLWAAYTGPLKSADCWAYSLLDFYFSVFLVVWASKKHFCDIQAAYLLTDPTLALLSTSLTQASYPRAILTFWLCPQCGNMIYSFNHLLLWQTRSQLCTTSYSNGPCNYGDWGWN